MPTENFTIVEKGTSLHPETNTSQVYDFDKSKFLNEVLDDFTTKTDGLEGFISSSQNHISNTSNPHGVTKAQVGLGLVNNYATATQVQAEQGTDNATFMTPLRTKQAITTNVGTVVSDLNTVTGRLTNHESNSSIHLSSSDRIKLDNSLSANTYSPSNSIVNISNTTASRVMPQINWTLQTGQQELWQTTLPLETGYFGYLEIDIAAFSTSGGAKFILDLGIGSNDDPGTPSIEYAVNLKTVYSTNMFRNNFRVEVEHIPTSKNLIIKVYKNNFNDPIKVTLTAKLVDNPFVIGTAFQMLSRFSNGSYSPTTFRIDNDPQWDLFYRAPLVGYFTPEGSVTAEPGTLYRARSTARLYVKESGEGNTGWVMK